MSFPLIAHRSSVHSALSIQYSVVSTHPSRRCLRCHWRGLYSQARKDICVAHMTPWSNGFRPDCADFKRAVAPPALSSAERGPRTFTVAELAAALGKSEDYVHLARRSGAIKGFYRTGHSGRRYQIAAPDFQRTVKELAL